MARTPRRPKLRHRPQWRAHRVLARAIFGRVALDSDKNGRRLLLLNAHGRYDKSERIAAEGLVSRALDACAKQDRMGRRRRQLVAPRGAPGAHGTPRVERDIPQGGARCSGLIARHREMGGGAMAQGAGQGYGFRHPGEAMPTDARRATTAVAMPTATGGMKASLSVGAALTRAATTPRIVSQGTHAVGTIGVPLGEGWTMLVAASAGTEVLVSGK